MSLKSSQLNNHTLLAGDLAGVRRLPVCVLTFNFTQQFAVHLPRFSAHTPNTGHDR